MPCLIMWNGPIGGKVDQYQVQFYPTIYVIDAKGVIRYKHVRNDVLAQAVDALLKEMDEGK